MVGKDTRGDPEKQAAKPGPIGKDWKDTLDRAEKEQEDKLHETNKHEMKKPDTTLTGQVAPGATAHGPGPAQVPFEELKKQR